MITKKNKIILLIALIIMLVGIVRFSYVHAYQGKGYFYEQPGEDIPFLILKNNLRVNGFLAVEESVSENNGKPGDLLVEKIFYLDADAGIFFCQEEREVETNIPQNLNCANKVMRWNDNGVVVIKEALHQINTEKIISSNQISFLANNRISANNPVRLSGCFSNDVAGDCDGGDLNTVNFYAEELNHLPVCLGGANDGKICNNDGECPGGKCNFEILLNPQELVFKELNLGPEENIDNQYLCFKIKSNENCSDYNAVVRGGDDDDWSFESVYPCVDDSDCPRGACLSGKCKYFCEHPESGTCISTGAQLCCYLDVLNL